MKDWSIMARGGVTSGQTEEFFRSILCFVELLYYVNSLLISVNIQVFV